MHVIVVFKSPRLKDAAVDVSCLSVMLGDGCYCSLSGSECCQEQRTSGSFSSHLQVDTICVSIYVFLFLLGTDMVLLLVV